MTTTVTVADVRAETIRTMPEKTLQAFVVAAARTAGFRLYHTYDSRKSEAGFPDLVMLRNDRIIVAELKRHGKKPTLAQEEWLEAFRQIPGVEVYVWRPEDWTDRTIIETLEAGA